MIRSIFLAVLVVVLSLIFSSCPLPTGPDDDGENGDPTPSGPVLVTIGDSITMGIQDAGLKYDFQVNNYPYLIAPKPGQPGDFEATPKIL